MAIKTFKNLKANLAAIPTPLNAFVNPIDVLVKRIREKISCLPNSKNFLLTSRGIGYKLEP